MEQPRGVELSKIPKEKLWERGAELVKAAKPQRRGESILPEFSYHPWFYHAHADARRRRPLMHAVAEAGLPTKAFYAMADAIMDENTSQELSEITWELLARQSDRSSSWAISSDLHHALTPMVEITASELLEPRPKHEAMTYQMNNRGIYTIASAVWNAHYKWRAQDNAMEVMLLVMKRLSMEMKERGLFYDVDSMVNMAQRLHGRGELVSILRNAWRSDIHRFIEFHEMVQEYNDEWALAAFDWERDGVDSPLST